MEDKFGSDLANMNFNFLSEDPVHCILCNEIFIINHDIQVILKHLLEVHKFVIGSPEEVADFRHYVLYWKKLQFTRLEDYCIIYITNTEQDAKASPEKFYLLCDKLPEDKHFRLTLRQMKLNFITRQKEAEYQDKNFSRRCMYCPTIIGGGIANSFHHLTFEHGFSLGNPDNIVFGAKLLDIMDDMLQRLQCLHCEKTFKNHLSLRGHMRKKQHRSLNPRNKQYDKFYLLHYLKPGVPWEEAKRSIWEEKDSSLSREFETFPEDPEETLEEEQLWTDWREDAGGVPAVCLFCPFTTAKIPTLLHHLEEHHRFQFETLTKDLNFYSKVKLINFIRTRVGQCKCANCEVTFESNKALLDHINTCSFSSLLSSRLWDNPGYLIPFVENDGLLIHLDDDDIDDEDTSSIASSVNDEIVLPEDAIPVASILNDWKLREELSEDFDGEVDATGSASGMGGALFKCFFCSFTMSGFGGRSICINHMNAMHGFNYKDVSRTIGEENRTKIVNYIRAQTDLGKCFVCGKSYITKGALEEHRILEGHINLPPCHLYDGEQWKTNSAFARDGFLVTEYQQGR